MKAKFMKRLAVLAVAMGSLISAPSWSEDFKGFPGGANSALGTHFDTTTPFYTNNVNAYVKIGRVANTPTTYLRNWNRIALDATGLDHTPVAPGDTRVFGEQFGPTRSGRAMAIVHIAIFDALNAIDNRYQNYTGIQPVRKNTSRRAAIAQAAHDTLIALFPSQVKTFDTQLAFDLDQIPNGKQKARGIALGKLAASSILALRSNDQSAIPEPVIGVDFIPNPAPGFWNQDPISLVPLAVGANWNQVTPFVLKTGDQFRLPPPPALNSAEYAEAYNEVKTLGGDGTNTPTTRTQDQTVAGIFWAYDGTPSLCAPPRLYNQVALKVASVMHTNNALKLARLLALVNTSMADAGIAAWDSKFFYQLWRPVGGIRGGELDGNPNTQGDVNFSPLGGPSSNIIGVNFTPPFPAYPSGHATFGGSLFQMLRNFYGTDYIRFSFTSDEFNGQTRDNLGNVRPIVTRNYNTLSQAEEENGQSRIYLGVHWAYDKTRGITLGNTIANYVYGQVFKPLTSRNDDNYDDSDFDG
ncbi:MAG: chloroperoxidase [Methylobacter sp.]|nr:MAG: chloroperoxidase [Methylobacter sp.]